MLGSEEGGCRDFWKRGEVSCTAATGRWLSPGMEAERGRGERGNNETSGKCVVRRIRHKETQNVRKKRNM